MPHPAKTLDRMSYDELLDYTQRLEERLTRARVLITVFDSLMRQVDASTLLLDTSTGRFHSEMCENCASVKALLRAIVLTGNDIWPEPPTPIYDQ